MRLTIIPTDKVIIIDGVAVHLDKDGATQFPTTDSNIHAIQWYENKGSKQKVDNSELEWFEDSSRQPKTRKYKFSKSFVKTSPFLN